MDRDGDASLDECIAFTLLTLRCCGPVRDSPSPTFLHEVPRPDLVVSMLVSSSFQAWPEPFARGDFDRLRRSIADAEVSPSTLL